MPEKQNPPTPPTPPTPPPPLPRQRPTAPYYEGKAKTIFESNDDRYLIQHFKDDATAHNAAKHAILHGKGILNNLISETLMQAVAQDGTETHFIKRLNLREQLIHRLEIIPIEVVLRAYAAGSLVKRLGGGILQIKDGDPLPTPLIEFYLKDDALGDPIISPQHITLFGLTSQAELEKITAMTTQIHTTLKSLFKNINIKLIDFKLEFGRWHHEDGRIILADEISPDTCRLWDRTTHEKKDKDRFRDDLGGMLQAYADIAQRLKIDINALNIDALDIDKTETEASP